MAISIGRKTYFVIIANLIIVFIFFVYYITESGYFPVMIINQHIVTKKDFAKLTLATIEAYKEKNQDKNTMEVMQEVLGKFIENQIVEEEAKRRIGDLIGILAREKIEKEIILKPDFPGTDKVYNGMLFPDFEKLVLVPFVTKQLLIEKMSQEGDDFNVWIKNQSEKLNVYILIQGFGWNGQGVFIKKFNGGDIGSKIE